MMAKLLNRGGRGPNTATQVMPPDDREDEVQCDTPEADDAALARMASHLRRTAWIWVFLASFMVWGLVLAVVLSALL